MTLSYVDVIDSSHGASYDGPHWVVLAVLALVFGPLILVALWSAWTTGRNSK